LTWSLEIAELQIDVAVADGVLWMQSLYVDEFLATGVVPGVVHNVLTGRYACYGVYACGDGGFLAVGAIEPTFFTNLCRALGLEQWAAKQYDDSVQDELRAHMRASFATRSRDAWVADLASADCCVAPVLTIEEVVRDEQFAARGTFVKASHAGRADFMQVGPVLAGAPSLRSPATQAAADRDPAADNGAGASSLASAEGSQ